MTEWLHTILKKINLSEVSWQHLIQINNPDLNTFLINLFRQRTKRKTISDLTHSFQANRFFKPSSIDPVSFKSMEIEALKLASAHGFELQEIAPLAPLGTCSVMGIVDQNNVVSATRDAEVLADATNVLALQIAKKFSQSPEIEVLKYACTARHTRAQSFDNPAFSAHFGVFCLVTGGKDVGNHAFEQNHFLDHIRVHQLLAKHLFPLHKISLKVYVRDVSVRMLANIKTRLADLFDADHVTYIDPAANNAYYPTIQFKMFLSQNGQEINISDGGIVDWTQRLMNNKKQRLMISGAGTELMHHLKYNA